MGPPRPIRSTAIRSVTPRKSQILPERFSLPEGTEIVHPDGAVHPLPPVAAHQAAGKGVLLDDGDAKAQQGKDDSRRKASDPGADDQCIIGSF